MQVEKNQQRKSNYFTWIIGMSIVLVSYLFSTNLIKFLIRRVESTGALVVTLNPVETISLIVTGTLMLTIVGFVPFVSWKSYQYMKDALYESERKTIKKTLKWSILPMLGFMMGLAITEFFILPFLLNTMSNYGLVSILGLGQVINLYLINSMIMGSIFILPIGTKVASEFNIVTKKQWKKNRREIYFLGILLIALVTPTTDAITLIAMSVPLLLVYELSILTIKNKGGVIIR